MEKTKRQDAIKKLEKELKDEKAAEITRRREITLERKKAAEERQRIEEAKAQVCTHTSRPSVRSFTYSPRLDGCQKSS